MKRIIIALTAAIAITATASAQGGFRLGAKAGANLTKVSGKAFNEEFDLGYHLGAFSEIDFNKRIGIQPELMWSQVNTKRASNFNQVYNNWRDSTGSIQLSYLSIPILFRYNIGNTLTLNVGPQFGILIDQSNTLLQNGENAFKSGDFSMVGGATLNLKAFRIYGRYNIGLSDIGDIDNQEEWKNQQIQLGIGLRL